MKKSILIIFLAFGLSSIALAIDQSMKQRYFDVLKDTAIFGNLEEFKNFLEQLSPTDQIEVLRHQDAETGSTLLHYMARMRGRDLYLEIIHSKCPECGWIKNKKGSSAFGTAMELETWEHFFSKNPDLQEKAKRELILKNRPKDIAPLVEAPEQVADQAPNKAQKPLIAEVFQQLLHLQSLGNFQEFLQLYRAQNPVLRRPILEYRHPKAPHFSLLDYLAMHRGVDEFIEFYREEAADLLERPNPISAETPIDKAYFAKTWPSFFEKFPGYAHHVEERYEIPLANRLKITRRDSLEKELLPLPSHLPQVERHSGAFIKNAWANENFEVVEFHPFYGGEDQQSPLLDKEYQGFALRRKNSNRFYPLSQTGLIGRSQGTNFSIKVSLNSGEHSSNKHQDSRDQILFLANNQVLKVGKEGLQLSAMEVSEKEKLERKILDGRLKVEAFPVNKRVLYIAAADVDYKHSILVDLPYPSRSSDAARVLYRNQAGEVSEISVNSMKLYNESVFLEGQLADGRPLELFWPSKELSEFIQNRGEIEQRAAEFEPDFEANTYELKNDPSVRPDPLDPYILAGHEAYLRVGGERIHQNNLIELGPQSSAMGHMVGQQYSALKKYAHVGRHFSIDWREDYYYSRSERKARARSTACSRILSAMKGQ